MTPPAASHKADFSERLIAASITAAFTNPKNTEPIKLKKAATPNAIKISKSPKVV